VVNLNDFTNCPTGPDCLSCGTAEHLTLAIVQTPAGVFCLTVCTPCGKAMLFPNIEARACERMAEAHCEHLGITVADMRVTMIKEALREYR
jgi:hypothetical protein